MRMRSLKAIGIGACLLLGVAGARAQEGVSASALNRGEFTQEETSRRQSFRDRFDVDLRYRELLFGLRYELDEEIRVDTLLGEGLTKRYFEYRRDWFSGRAGNFYTTFGRGLTFRTLLDDNVHMDQDMDGLKVALNHRLGELQAIAGRPHSEVNHRRDDLVSGGALLAQPAANLSLGGTYLRREATNAHEDPSWGLPVEELGSGLGRVTWRDFDLYGEYAQRWAWGRYDPLSGWIGMDNLRGQASYGSLTFSPEGWGLTVDYKDYRKFDFQYNGPPWVNRLNRSVNTSPGLDERGWQGELTWSPTPSTNLVGNFSDGWSRDYVQRMQHGYGELKYQRLGKGTLILWGEGRALRLVEPSIALKKEGAGHADLSYYLTRIQTLSATAEARQVRSRYIIGLDEKYWDAQGILTYGYAPYLGVSAIVRGTSIRVTEYNNEKLWPIGEVVLTLGAHQLKVRYGKERGGIDCSSGVCRYEPPFSGLKVTAVSRF